jgi:hypothetical protein
MHSSFSFFFAYSLLHSTEPMLMMVVAPWPITIVQSLQTTAEAFQLSP